MERQLNQKPMRRRPWALGVVIFLGLIFSGGGYAVATQTYQAEFGSPEQISEGRKLFLANCASCHGTNGEGALGGPSLIGVGAASVDFQVGTGRMPGQASGPQLYKKPVQFTEEQILAMAACVASLAPGPAIPAEEFLKDVIANVISEDPSDNAKAQKRFDEILNKAVIEYNKYKGESEYEDEDEDEFSF